MAPSAEGREQSGQTILKLCFSSSPFHPPLSLRPWDRSSSLSADKRTDPEPSIWLPTPLPPTTAL